MPGRIPRVYRAEAIVLRHRRLGEADQIVTLFTPQLGKVEAIAKGIRKPTSRKAGHLELLSWTSLLLACGQNLDVVTQAEIVESFTPLREDLQRLARGMYIAELVDRFSGPRVENYPVFRLLAETLQRLSSSPALDLAVRYFEMQLLANMGYSPQLGSCVACKAALRPVENSFSSALGGVVCPDCRRSFSGIPRLGVNTLKVLRLLQRGSFDDVARLRLPAELLGEIELMLRSYVRYVLEQNPRSLQFMDAVRRAAVPPDHPRPELAKVAEQKAVLYVPGAENETAVPGCG